MFIIDRTIRSGRLALACIGLLSLFACGGGDPELAADAGPSAHALSAAPSAASKGATVEGDRRIDFTKFTDKVAVANYFEYNTEDHCVATTITIFAYKSKQLADGTTTNDDGASAYAARGNYCEGIEISSFNGATDKSVVHINQLGASARGKGEGLEFYENVTQKLAINLTWNGGQDSGTNTKTVTMGPGTKSIVKTSSSFRNADSVTGSLVIGGVDYLSPNRVNFGWGIYGYVSTSGTTTIEIVRGN